MTAARIDRSPPSPGRYQWTTAMLLLLASLLWAWAGASLAQTAAPAPPQVERAPVDLPKLSTEIRLEVLGPSARVWVEQTFSNPSTEWIQANYRFPLPPDAAVDALTVDLGDRILEGEIRERKSARREFRSAAASGQATALWNSTRATCSRPGSPISHPTARSRFRSGFPCPPSVIRASTG